IKGITATKSSPLLVDGKLYVADDGANLYTFDAETAKQIGRRTKLVGTMLSSSPIWADGKIYVLSTGALNVLQPTANGPKSLFKTRLDTPASIIGSPAISHGRIYLPTPSGLYCLGKKDHKPQATERPAPPQEKPIGENTKPAWALVVPGEVLLKPNEKQQFSVRLFNDRGQFLKQSKAEFTLAGPGEIIAEGEFTAPGGNGHTSTLLTAKVGDLTAKARIRVIPPLPWKFDFNDIPLAADSKSGRTEGEPPVTWVGARYRHKVREVDGERAMVKVTTIPVGTRSQMWMGHPDLHDYTTQADLKASLGGNRSTASIGDSQLPDMGVIAQRYMIDMMGQSQQLQIRSWPPQVATH
ncbi:MAG: PQQ-binding-like beta-propeller repeat protein, partial [Pirellulaceae bacterium]